MHCFPISFCSFPRTYYSSSAQWNLRLTVTITSLPHLAHSSDPPASSSPHFSCHAGFHLVLPRENDKPWSSSSSSFAFCFLLPSYNSFPIFLSYRWKTSCGFLPFFSLPLSQSYPTCCLSLQLFLPSCSLFALTSHIPLPLYSHNTNTIQSLSSQNIIILKHTFILKHFFSPINTMSFPLLPSSPAPLWIFQLQTLPGVHCSFLSFATTAEILLYVLGNLQHSLNTLFSAAAAHWLPAVVSCAV